MKIYLKDWRLDRDVTQAEVARRVGVTKGAISRWEAGKRRYNSDWMAALAKALNIKPEDLFHHPNSRPRHQVANENVIMEPKRPVNQNTRGGCLTMFSANPAESSFSMFPVVGDEMKPTMKAGDAVMVDLKQRVATPAGLFLIDEMGQKVVRRLQMITDKDVRVICDNKIYTSSEGPVDRLEIIGRVVAHVAQI